MRKQNKIEVKKHAEEAYATYKTVLDSPENAFWLMHPRDYHYLKSELNDDKPNGKPMPQLLELDAVVAHIWRKPPIIAMNIEDIDFLEETTNDV